MVEFRPRFWLTRGGGVTTVWRSLRHTLQSLAYQVVHTEYAMHFVGLLFLNLIVLPRNKQDLSQCVSDFESGGLQKMVLLGSVH